MPTQRQLNIIQRAARRHGINPAILYGVWGAESNFGQNRNTSGAGAQGPFQFMPATARSYGIDPYNFRQAANAAAKYLGTYQDRGLAGMLAAYNAGPAGNPNNAETQAYIPKVRQLARQFPGGGGGGGDPGGDGGAPSGPSGGQSALGDAGSTLALLQALQGGQQPSQPASGGLAAPAHSAGPVLAQGAQQVVSGGGPAPKPDPQALMAAIRTVGGGLPGVPGTDGGAAPGGGQVSGGRDPQVKGPLREMFLNVKGAVNADEGKRVPLGYVSGHETHAHVAGQQRDMKTLGGLAERMGLVVRENPAFDKVDPVHTTGSFHYGRREGGRSYRALDVSGDPRKLLAFNRRVARLYGLR